MLGCAISSTYFANIYFFKGNYYMFDILLQTLVVDALCSRPTWSRYGELTRNNRVSS